MSVLLRMSLLMPLALMACTEKENTDDVDGDGVEASQGDCDDTNPAINPSATDLAGDEIDQNCDGVDGTDADLDGVASVESGGTDCDDTDSAISDGGTYYADGDGDGFGNAENSVTACEAPAGFVEDNTDCDDSSARVNPMGTEICDGLDNDCDELVDADDDSIEGALTVYADEDGDEYGSAAVESLACEILEGWVGNSDDCDDTQAEVNPRAEELLGDGIDNNCDSKELCYQDTDNDGFGSENTSLISADGSGVFDCEATANVSLSWADCDDSDSAIHPAAAEICDSGIDNDCDGLIDDQDDSLDSSTGSSFYADLDGDGFGDGNSSLMACELQAGMSSNPDDCNDGVSGINPLATDVVDSIDQNCDGIDGIDADGDGAASIFSGGTDCDDSDASVHPSAAEVCDGIDNDCSGVIDDNPTDGSSFYADLDGDGFGDPAGAITACEEGNGASSNDSDCDDSNGAVNPYATDVVGDSIDQNCDGIDGTDVDGDGFASISSGGTDCDDSDALVDGSTDSDGDGFSCADDCDDSDATVYPGALEQAEDGIDQDCDGGDPEYVSHFGDIPALDEEGFAQLCATTNVIYGGVDVDLSLLDSNSTASIDCLSEVHGTLYIYNGDVDSVISFADLVYVEDLNIGNGSYDFPVLEEIFSSLRMQYIDGATTIDGDLSFPVLSSVGSMYINDTYSLTDVIGFSSVTELSSLFLYSNSLLENLSILDNLVEINTIDISYQDYLIDIGGFSSLDAILSQLTIDNNDALENTTGFYNLSSINRATIYSNDLLDEDGCIYYHADGDLSGSYVDLGLTGFSSDYDTCDFDQDGYSLIDGDCDDFDAGLNLDDTDGDGYSLCDEDCDDNDAAFNPGATEIYYDGIDQNCDGSNDFDQDQDGDNVVELDCDGDGVPETSCDLDGDGIDDFIGGSDCDDTDWSLQGLDLDGDGTTTCDGDDPEVVESCQDHYLSGSTADGVYTMLLVDGSSYDAYCDMNTENGGWTRIIGTDSYNHDWGQTTSDIVTSYVTASDTVGVAEAFAQLDEFSQIMIKKTSDSYAGEYAAYDLVETISGMSVLDILQYCRDQPEMAGNDTAWDGERVIGHTSSYSGTQYSGNLMMGSSFGTVSPAYFFMCGVNESSDNDQSAMAFADSPGDQNSWGDSWRNTSQRGAMWSFWNNDYHTSSRYHIGNGSAQAYAGYKTYSSTNTGSYEIYIR